MKKKYLCLLVIAHIGMSPNSITAAACSSGAAAAAQTAYDVKRHDDLERSYISRPPEISGEEQVIRKFLSPDRRHYVSTSEKAMDDYPAAVKIGLYTQTGQQVGKNITLKDKKQKSTSEEGDIMGSTKKTLSSHTIAWARNSSHFLVRAAYTSNIITDESELSLYNLQCKRIGQVIKTNCYPVWNPNFTRFIVCSNGGAQLYDAARRKLKNLENVRSIHWSPDSTKFIKLSILNAANLYNAEGHNIEWSKWGIKDVQRVIWSADSASFTVKLADDRTDSYNATTGEKILGHQQQILAQQQEQPQEEVSVSSSSRSLPSSSSSSLSSATYSSSSSSSSSSVQPQQEQSQRQQGHGTKRNADKADLPVQ